MKELSWIQMSDYMHTLQEFTRLAVLKQTELTTASAGEMDLLSRIYLLKSPVTPLQLSQQMKMKKSSISRIIHHLLEKELIIKQKNELDGRSYHLILTQKGQEQLKQHYEQFLTPIYLLYRKMGQEQFLEFIKNIQTATCLLQE